MKPSAYLGTIGALAFIIASGTAADAQQKTNQSRQITVEKAAPDAGQGAPDQAINPAQGNPAQGNPAQGAVVDQGNAGDGGKVKIEQGAAVDQRQGSPPTGAVEQAPQDGANGPPPIRQQVVRPHQDPVEQDHAPPPRYQGGSNYRRY